jgi:hypothetical protein
MNINDMWQPLNQWHVNNEVNNNVTLRVCSIKNTKTTERGGESIVTVLKKFMTIKTIFKILQVTINIIQHMNNMSNEHQSHIRYKRRQIFTRKPIKGENLFFFE